MLQNALLVFKVAKAMKNCLSVEDYALIGKYVMGKINESPYVKAWAIITSNVSAPQKGRMSKLVSGLSGTSEIINTITYPITLPVITSKYFQGATVQSPYDRYMYNRARGISMDSGY